MTDPDDLTFTRPWQDGDADVVDALTWIDETVTFATPPPPGRLERIAVALARRSPRASMLILGVPILGRALRRYAELEYRRAAHEHLTGDQPPR